MLLNDHAVTGTTDVQGWTELHQVFSRSGLKANGDSRCSLG